MFVFIKNPTQKNIVIVLFKQIFTHNSSMNDIKYILITKDLSNLKLQMT